jgi:TonB-linked SusC/RagA family outer membrane protein
MRKFLLTIVLMSMLVVAWAQQRTISGRVTSVEDGSSLPGVNVVIKGTTEGTVTDSNGGYSISIPDGDVRLVFTFIGLESMEVEVGQKTSLDAQMKTDIKQLSEVVVTAVGIQTEKRALGYSIQSVKSDDIVSSRETNLVSALAGKAAGVQIVSSSGSPGASANIRIRGNKSITGDNSPLFVIDGIPVDNSNAGNGVGGVDNSNRAIDINPNDIESISVLKGPAATALYGLRASNGAIVISTKRGKEGKQVVEISSSYRVDEVNKLYELQNTYAQGRPRFYAGKPATADGTYLGPETGEQYSWGPRIADLEFANDESDLDGFGSGYVFDKNGILVLKGNGNGNPAKAYDQYDFFKRGSTIDNTIAISGGNQSTNYYFSAGYLSQTGIVPNSTFERKSVRANVETSLGKNLRGGINVNYTNSGGDRIQRGSNISGVMLGLLRNTPTFDMGNGSTGQRAADDPTSYILPNNKQRSYRNGVYDSPYWTVNKNPNTDNVDRIFGNLSFKYDPFSWLSINYKLGGDTYTDHRKAGLDVFSAANPEGAMFFQDIYSQNINSDLLATITKNIDDKFDFTVTLGHNYFTQLQTQRTTTGTGLGQPGFFNISNAKTITSTEVYNTRRKIAGAFADVKIGYKDFLFLNLSGRNDWSSTLPKANNSFFYPAVSLGFAFTELLKLEENPILSFGKLRASWGKVGNDAPAFSTANNYVSSAVNGDGFIAALGAPIFGQPSYERSLVRGNPLLKPEFTTTTEFGGELKLWRSRIDVDVTYYSSLTQDAIVQVNAAPSTGFGVEFRNSAEIENKGWEIVIDANVLQIGEFSWDLGVNFNAYTNVVKKLAEGVDNVVLSGFTVPSSNAVVNQPYGVIFGSRFARNDDGKLLIGNDGWPLIAPTNGAIGNPIPDWTAGVRNTFSWKGISLSTFIDIRQGGDMWNGTRGILDYFGTSKESADLRNVKGYVFDGVRNSDGQPNTTPVDFYPTADPVTGQYPSNDNAFSSIRWTRFAFGGLSEEYMEETSWVRLREVSINYSLPKNMLKNLAIKAVNISLTGRNLVLITDYKGIDPETNLTGASNGVGMDYFNMPNTKSYGAAVKLTF